MLDHIFCVIKCTALLLWCRLETHAISLVQVISSRLWSLHCFHLIKQRKSIMLSDVWWNQASKANDCDQSTQTPQTQVWVGWKEKPTTLCFNIYVCLILFDVMLFLFLTVRIKFSQVLLFSLFLFTRQCFTWKRWNALKKKNPEKICLHWDAEGLKTLPSQYQACGQRSNRRDN